MGLARIDCIVENYYELVMAKILNLKCCQDIEYRYS